MGCKILTNNFGGGALTRAALADSTPPEWYNNIEPTTEAWEEQVRKVRAEFGENPAHKLSSKWLQALWPAFTKEEFGTPAKSAALRRLQRVYAEGGVVITTGQQPGLFGGPMYTWSKALTALALADRIEEQTGVPVAPVFWAATDDSDLVEASSTVVVHGSVIRRLSLPEIEEYLELGQSMSSIPLPDLQDELRQLEWAAGSAINRDPLVVARESYTTSETVGSAYVRLLRKSFEDIGISVLDSSHPSVREAGEETIRLALRNAEKINKSLLERSESIEGAGFKVQVRPVSSLSLVFSSASGGRKRIPVKGSAEAARTENATDMSPNVLLRPVVESRILPTVAYVGGPAEYAYFAQVSAVAEALEVRCPVIVPRWSGTVIEPEVQRLLDEYSLTVEDFRDPHAVEGKIAREDIPQEVRTALSTLSSSLDNAIAGIASVRPKDSPQYRSAKSFHIHVSQRISRLERRFAAEVKREGSVRLKEIATIRAALFPEGVPQERIRNILPLFARYGLGIRDAMLESARDHVLRLVSEESVSAVIDE